MEQNKFRQPATKCTFLIMGLSLAFLLSGCLTFSKPRQRIGAFFGSPTGVEFANPQKLGNHQFSHGLEEKNGMVYTCKAGFIDIGHLREAADRTRYLADVTYRKLMLKRKKFSFRVIEPSRYWVKISYPQNWYKLPVEEKEKIAKETSICLGQYFAHTSLIWHEILTWFGFSSVGIFPENISAFSWEDSYSDLLGTQIAAEVLLENQQQFDDAMTKLIDEKLEALDVQPAGVARRAAKQIKGKWFTGGLYFLVDMKKRNFDVGLDDGFITPCLVPGICPDTEPQLCQAPSLEPFYQHGFKMELEIDTRTMEKSKIYKTIDLQKSGTRIRPQVHFPEILQKIQ